VTIQLRIGKQIPEVAVSILPDLSNTALKRAIEFNQIGFLEYFGRFERVTIIHSSEMVRLLTESGPFPILNRVVGAQFGIASGYGQK